MTQPNGMDIPQILTPDAAGGPAVRMNHIGVGRLLVVNATAIQEDAPHMSGTTKPRIIADVAIMDGATPFDFGGSIQKRRPHSNRVTRLPYLVRGMWIQEAGLVKQLRSRIGQGVVVGRLNLGQGTNGNNDPWVLDDPTPEEVDYVRRWLTAKATGQWTNPDPIELQVPQAAPAQAGQWVGSGAPVAPQQAPPLGHSGDPWATPTAPATTPPQSGFGAAPTQSEPPMPSGFDPAKWAVASLYEKNMIVKFMGGGAPAQTAPPQPATAGGPAYW